MGCVDNLEWCKGPAENGACVACTIKYFRNLLDRMIQITDPKKLSLRKKMGEGDFEGTHFEFGLIVPYTMYVEVDGKIAALNMGEVVPECIRRIKEEL